MVNAANTVVRLKTIGLNASWVADEKMFREIGADLGVNARRVDNASLDNILVAVHVDDERQAMSSTNGSPQIEIRRSFDGHVRCTITRRTLERTSLADSLHQVELHFSRHKLARPLNDTQASAVRSTCFGVEYKLQPL